MTKTQIRIWNPIKSRTQDYATGENYGSKTEY